MLFVQLRCRNNVAPWGITSHTYTRQMLHFKPNILHYLSYQKSFIFFVIMNKKRSLAARNNIDGLKSFSTSFKLETFLKTQFENYL